MTSPGRAPRAALDSATFWTEFNLATYVQILKPALVHLTTQGAAREYIQSWQTAAASRPVDAARHPRALRGGLDADESTQCIPAALRISLFMY